MHLLMCRDWNVPKSLLRGEPSGCPVSPPGCPGAASSWEGRCIFLLVARWVVPLINLPGQSWQFIFIFYVILFIGLLSLCCYAGFSPLVATGGYSPGTVLGLLNVVASLAVAHGLSCPTACGIFPDQGSHPCPPYWQADSLSLSHQGSPTAIC